MIQFESVGKTFRDGTAAVVDLNLTVPSRQVTVLVGPPGCGATTALQMVNRMLEPTTGRLLWDGTPLKSRRRTALRRQMGYVVPGSGLFPHRTMLENITTVPGLLRWSRSRTQKRSLELLGLVGLDRKLAHRYPAQLSGGQRQRVGIARALAADPQVLLMDEPFSDVDPVVRADLHELFLRLQRELGRTVILVTHDIDEAVRLADQVAILRVGGRLAQVGTPQQLLEEPADAFVAGFVGRDRGYRSLSFVPAGALSLDSVRVVRDVEAAARDEPTLVVDADARPVGWADPARPGRLAPLGSTFQPESDTLRTALDSALTSPYGLAVAVEPSTGRFAGVAAAATILRQATERRAVAVAAVTVSGPGVDERADGWADPSSELPAQDESAAQDESWSEENPLAADPWTETETETTVVRNRGDVQQQDEGGAATTYGDDETSWDRDLAQLQPAAQPASPWSRGSEPGR